MFEKSRQIQLTLMNSNLLLDGTKEKKQYVGTFRFVPCISNKYAVLELPVCDHDGCFPVVREHKTYRSVSHGWRQLVDA